MEEPGLDIRRLVQEKALKVRETTEKAEGSMSMVFGPWVSDEQVCLLKSEVQLDI